MNNPISSITNGPRQSNMELLRIIAMFLILVIHADFWILDSPSADECLASPLPSITRILIESIAIVSVNVFVLISGWFTIRASVKGFCNLIFQCAYFFIGIYLVMLCFGFKEISFTGIRECMLLTKYNWFIKSYIGLYILSPVLNSFCNKATKIQYEIVLSAFFIFQTIYGMSGAAIFIEAGFSTFSFIGLYLLSQYLKRYGLALYKWGGVFFVVSILINTFVAYRMIIATGHPYFIYNYINPFVILGSIGLLLQFSTIRVKQSKIINWLGASSFAVYLTHANPNLAYTYFKPIILCIYQSFNGILCIVMIACLLMTIFIISCVLDQPRKWLWDIISKKIPNYKV